MATRSVEDIYEHHIRALSASEQLRLVELIASKLAAEATREGQQQRSLLELEGLGADLWQGIDAQHYVDELRQEWDQRP
jgi:hypothetical protein